MIERIDDPGDARIRDYSRVGDPAWLRANGLFVAEGRFVTERLIASRRFAVRSVLVTPAALGAVSAAGAVPVFVAEQPVLNAVSGFNFHRGCLALAERPAENVPDDLCSADRLLALEAVGNPDNVGGLFRVAAAFGAGGVLLDPASGDPLYRKAIRTSMGAALTVPFARAKAWPEDLERLRSAGFTIAALTPRADAVAISEVTGTTDRRLTLLLGAEGPGLSEAALAAADIHIRIPMVSGVDSLNVVVAAGVALSHLA